MNALLFHTFHSNEQSLAHPSPFDPRAKFVATLTLLILLSLSHTPTFPLVVCACLWLGIAACCKSWQATLLRFMAPISLAFFVAGMNCLIIGSHAAYVISTPLGAITIYQEGLSIATLMLAKIIAGVSALLLFQLSTPIIQLFSCLRYFGVSSAWLEIAHLMYRYLFVLYAATLNLYAAQKLRLGHSSWRRILSSSSIAAGHLFIFSYEQATRIEQSMAMRGGTGELPYAPMPKWPLASILTTLTGQLMIIAAWAISNFFLS